MELFVIPPDKIAKRPIWEGRFYEPGAHDVESPIKEAFGDARDSFFAILGSFARQQQTDYSDVDGLVFSLLPKSDATRLSLSIRDRLLAVRRNSDFTVGDESHVFHKMKFNNTAWAAPKNIRFVCGRQDLFDEMIAEWYRFFSGDTLIKRVREVGTWISKKPIKNCLTWSIGGYREAAFCNAVQELLGLPDTIAPHLKFIVELRKRLHSFHRSRSNFITPDAIELLRLDNEEIRHHQNEIHNTSGSILKVL